MFSFLWKILTTNAGGFPRVYFDVDPAEERAFPRAVWLEGNG